MILFANFSLLRDQLISAACRYEYPSCIDQSYELFQKWVDQPTSVNPNIRSYVYAYGLQKSQSEKDWYYVWDKYQAEKDAIEKSKLMSALTSSKNPNLISLLISYSHNQSIINNENFFSVQQSISSSSEIGRDSVWNYIKNNWENLIERFGLNDRRLGNYVKSVVSGFSTEARLDDVNAFFEKYPDAGAGEAARKEALETIEKNIDWLDTNGKDISDILNLRDEIQNPWLNWRLDESVKPVHYDINLKIDVDNEIFSGSMKIEINLTKPLRYLILHSKDLLIKSSTINTKVDNTLVSEVDSAFSYEPNQYWVVPLQKIILSGSYVAQFEFDGNLSQSLSGLYVSRYVDNKTRLQSKLATTQFQAIYARKAFPCFDEPQFKSTFSLSIEHHSKYKAVSNMPVSYIRSTENDYQITAFEKSVKMSTYLLAMVVGDIVSKPSPLYSNFSVYTYNPDTNLAKVDYALDVGPKILDFYAKKYFNIMYPLPKMDMISIPDFSMGAMENWGLVTYRDVYILYDDKNSNTASKMAVCSIIAHELAHMV